MYLDERLTAHQIATSFECSATTVRRQLVRFGIPARPRGPVPGSGRVGSALRTPPGWSADVAYVVGLITTDGNLGRKRAAMSIVSKDTDLLETVLRCLGLATPIKPHVGGYGTMCHHIVWRDRLFYDWLLSIGLTPAKSLTLGPLAIPDEYFPDFFRGCIDGDGSVLTYTDRYHVAKSERYVYERLYVSIVSASRPFVEWLRHSVARLTGLTGSITVRRCTGRRSIWQLRYAKSQSIRLVAWMYYAPTVPSLARKRVKAERFLTPLGYSSLRVRGRPRVGWLYQEPPVLVSFC